jgi:replication-associated recombination protein RarA
VENRWVTLVAATTENPFFSVISPLLSRSLLLTLEPLSDDDVRAVVTRALASDRGPQGEVQVDDDALDHLVRLAGGDARRSLTALEAAAGASDHVTLELLEQAVDRAAVRYDRDGDQHYDVISGFIKSIRGSDVDAAMHYLRGCSRRGRTRGSSPAGWSCTPARTSAWPTRPRCRSPSPPRRRSSSSGCPRRGSTSRRPPSTWRCAPRATP